MSVGYAEQDSIILLVLGYSQRDEDG